MKPYAILHSKFEEVLFIDVDNIPVRNPEFLFDSLPYRETGAIFWPDIWRLAPHRLIWSICGIDFRDEREFESGQIVIDKRRCWKALNVAMHLNEYSDFYYQHFLGDKETFHLAWMKLGQKYSMPARNAELRDNTLFQYDFEDKLLFQHRNGDKWRLKPRNKPIPGFQLEEVCFFFLDQLDVLLDEGSRKVRRWVPVNRSSRALETAQRLLGQRYVYFGHGQESRVIGLAANGTTKTGPERRERFWDLLENGEELSLEVSSENEPLFQVKAGPDGIWRGQTCGEERSSVEIVPQREHIGVAPLERIRTLSGHANGTPALSIENGAANPAQLARRFAASFPRIIHIVDTSSTLQNVGIEPLRTRWQVRHPGWKVEIWTENEITRLPGFAQTRVGSADCQEARVELLRYEVAWHHGGLCVDAAAVCLRNIEPLLTMVTTEVFAGFAPPASRFEKPLGTGVVGALPGATFLERFIKTLAGERSTSAHSATSEYAARGRTVSTSELLTMFAADSQEITVFPRHIFNPLPTENAVAFLRREAPPSLPFTPGNGSGDLSKAECKTSKNGKANKRKKPILKKIKAKRTPKRAKRLSQQSARTD